MSRHNFHMKLGFSSVKNQEREFSKTLMLKGLSTSLSITVALIVGISMLGGAAFFVTTSMPTASVAAEKTVSGEVRYRERIALPPEASLTVQLSDITDPNVPIKTVAETRIDEAQGSPIPFAIHFDSSQFKLGHSYALQARIAAGDTLWFVNEKPIEVDMQNSPTSANIDLVMVRKNMDEVGSAGIEGKDWLAEAILGSEISPNAHATLTVSDDGAASGSAGCNRFFGRIAIDGTNLSFSEIGSTYMQCPPALMQQERKFIDALNKTRSYRVETGKLFLIDEQGNDLASFSQSL
ncbi:putative lipoprotein [Falsochrobactrum ovis]|uniref:Putative lipoprotein n=2 Tax=Falsochrobactrum ovis TaxID=1293442 RepID=A0A364JV78_9HYPH|nr:META domain-containing protein [Falsochrobactrum ovis]RAK29001.1 putative lipoprotein [Falsochrobactrum ovis]